MPVPKRWHNNFYYSGISEPEKLTTMPNTKTDNRGFATENEDIRRDEGAKGGPATGIGNATDKHGISSPYDADIQTQLAAKAAQKKKEKDEHKNCDCE